MALIYLINFTIINTLQVATQLGNQGALVSGKGCITRLGMACRTLHWTKSMLMNSGNGARGPAVIRTSFLWTLLAQPSLIITTTSTLLLEMACWVRMRYFWPRTVLQWSLSNSMLLTMACFLTILQSQWWRWATLLLSLVLKGRLGKFAGGLTIDILSLWIMMKNFGLYMCIFKKWGVFLFI